jgi:hypothetical protein
MGFVTLGIFVFNQEGMNGAIFQMLNHGIITGALFTLIGAIYERSHSREIAKNLGLGKRLPAFMFFWGLFGLASFGFPGTNGFVGEFLVIAAAFREDWILGLCLAPGAMLAAAYILKVTLKLAWGQPASPAGHNWADLKKREWAYLALPAFLVIYLGLAPTGLLNLITPSVEDALNSFHARKALAAPSSYTVEDLKPVESSQSPKAASPADSSQEATFDQSASEGPNLDSEPNAGSDQETNFGQPASEAPSVGSEPNAEVNQETSSSQRPGEGPSLSSNRNAIARLNLGSAQNAEAGQGPGEGQYLDSDRNAIAILNLGSAQNAEAGQGPGEGQYFNSDRNAIARLNLGSVQSPQTRRLASHQPRAKAGRRLGAGQLSQGQMALLDSTLSKAIANPHLTEARETTHERS